MSEVDRYLWLKENPFEINEPIDFNKFPSEPDPEMVQYLKDNPPIRIEDIIAENEAFSQKERRIRAMLNGEKISE